MRILLTKDFTDKATKQGMKCGQEIIVKRKRGLELEKNGVARIVDEDDMGADDTQIAELKKTIKTLESTIKKLQK